MSEQPNTEAPDNDPSAADYSQPGFTAVVDESFDMSIENVPGGWVDAQLESPIGTGETVSAPQTPRLSAIPTGHQSPFISNIAAVGASFIGGSVWYLFEVMNVYRGPWIAVAIGLFIAVMIRMSGANEPSFRAMLSIISYLLTLLLVLILITHRELTDIYGTVSQFQAYEQTLVRTRLQDPVHLVAYGTGGFVAAWVAFLHRPGR